MAQIVPGRPLGSCKRFAGSGESSGNVLHVPKDVATFRKLPGKALGEPSVKRTTMRNPDWLSDGTLRSSPQASYRASAVAVGPRGIAVSMWPRIESRSNMREGDMWSLTVVPEENVISAIRSLFGSKDFTNVPPAAC